MSLHSQQDEDIRWMRAALAYAARGVGRTTPNPTVGCIIVKQGILLGRGWTQPGGRPHAEAMALAQAGTAAQGATLYTTLEPCTHDSPRGPDCAGSIIAAGLARVVSAGHDPDPRTHSLGHARLAAAGISLTEGVCARQATDLNLGFFTRLAHGRPAVTLKLATSLDGCFALADGTSQWITGDAARAHGHMERAQHDAIMVGRGTQERDQPKLDVRLPGLESRSPRILAPNHELPALLQEHGSKGLLSLLIEGGPTLAASFLKADLVDRLLCYRAPILIGGGLRLSDISLGSLTAAHGRWQNCDSRALGADHLDVYVRTRKA